MSRCISETVQDQAWVTISH